MPAALLAATIFFLVQLYLVQHHEMWRDELQAWLLVRDSAGIPELLQNLKYEGHPGLWHLLLLPLTRLSPGPHAMQVLHVAIASASIFVLVRYAPFHWTMKLLLCLSYFLFYEYAQLARNYAIGVLLVFILCALFPHRREWPLAMALVLFLLCHSSLFGIMLTLAFSAAVIGERLVRYGLRHALFEVRQRQILAGAIVWAGLLTSLLQVVPPDDFGPAGTWDFAPSAQAASEIMIALVSGYLPLPPVGPHYWGQMQLLMWPVSPYLPTALLLAFLAGFAFMLRRSPLALIFFALSSGGLLLFFYAKFLGYPRHHGFLFIALLASLWLAHHSVHWTSQRPAGRWTVLAARLGSGGLVLVLLVQAAAGLMAAAQDHVRSFSNAEKTAEFIKLNGLERGLIAGHTDFAASAVAGFLSTPLYYPQSDRIGTFVRWDNKRKPIGRREGVTRLTERMTGTESALLISNAPLFREARSIRLNIGGQVFEVTLLFESGPAVVRSEAFYLYRFEKK